MKYQYKIASAMSGILNMHGKPIASAAAGSGIINALKNFWKDGSNRVVVMGALTGLGINLGFQFVDNIISYLRDKQLAMKEPKYFKEMLDKNPHLLNYDPEHIAKLWATLYHTSPFLAEDPVAAGSFLKQMLDRGNLDQYGGPPPDTYKTLIEIEEKANKTRENKKSTGVPNNIKDYVAKNMLGNYAQANSPLLYEMDTDPKFAPNMMKDDPQRKEALNILAKRIAQQMEL